MNVVNRNKQIRSGQHHPPATTPILHPTPAAQLASLTLPDPSPIHCTSNPTPPHPTNTQTHLSNATVVAQDAVAPLSVFILLDRDGRPQVAKQLTVHLRPLTLHHHLAHLGALSAGLARAACAMIVRGSRGGRGGVMLAFGAFLLTYERHRRPAGPGCHRS